MLLLMGPVGAGVRPGGSPGPSAPWHGGVPELRPGGGSPVSNMTSESRVPRRVVPVCGSGAIGESWESRISSTMGSAGAVPTVWVGASSLLALVAMAARLRSMVDTRSLLRCRSRRRAAFLASLRAPFGWHKVLSGLITGVPVGELQSRGSVAFCGCNSVLSASGGRPGGIGGGGGRCDWSQGCVGFLV